MFSFQEFTCFKLLCKSESENIRAGIALWRRETLKRKICFKLFTLNDDGILGTFHVIITDMKTWSVDKLVIAMQRLRLLYINEVIAWVKDLLQNNVLSGSRSRLNLCFLKCCNSLISYTNESKPCTPQESFVTVFTVQATVPVVNIT